MIEQPFLDPGFLRLAHDVERTVDGGFIVRCRVALSGIDRDVISPIERWAAAAPDRAMLIERLPSGDGFRSIGYAEALQMIWRLGTGLRAMGLGQARPLMILSGNSIPHAMIAYAAALIGVPVCPVSVAYSLADTSLARLAAILDIVRPAAVFAEQGDRFAAAIERCEAAGCQVICGSGGPASAVSLLSLSTQGIAPDLQDRRAELTGETVLRFALTSGSTGSPKAVVVTHGMVATGAAMIRAAFSDDALAEPPVTISGLPWSHTFGVNAHLHQAVVDGGTLVIDPGAPTRDRIGATIATLRAIQPIGSYTTVPVAWELLAHEFERDPAFARHFFERLRWIAYGGAAMPQSTGDRLQRAAIAATGHRIAITTGYGATETAPAMAMVTQPDDRVGRIGLPLPGATLKLVPAGDRFEARVKGEVVMKRYLGARERTDAAFDADGYYRMGDAVQLDDPENPLNGVRFAGRMSEDFKLASGTFVAVGPLRSALLERLGDHVLDVVPCGENRSKLGLLIFPGTGCNDERIKTSIWEHNRSASSATHIGRYLVLNRAPSIELGEITDKGAINQHRVREVWATTIDQLLGDERPD